MGRPRKRQLVEAANGDTTLDQPGGPQDFGFLPPFMDDFDAYNDGMAAEPYFPTGEPALAPPDAHSDLSTKIVKGRTVWHFGDREVMGGPPIDFGDLDIGDGKNAAPLLDPVPQLSTISNPSTTDSEGSPPVSASGPCSCLASMYLSLAALQQFPNDIVEALKTVRGAAATAAASLWCPQCGSVLMDTTIPPIESFQNTMLLGTILPIIANGYGKLLKMIDAETDSAIAEGKSKYFRFQDYGGMCGRTETVEQSITCVAKDLLFNEVEMPPAQWRTTVYVLLPAIISLQLTASFSRALLRVDIYGHEQPGFKHKGLKDLVSEMEYRQRVRHEFIDAQEAAGTLENVGHFPFLHDKCLGEKTRGCLEILKMAKLAIDGLVIA